MNKIFTILVLWIGVLCLGCEDDPKFHSSILTSLIISNNSF